MKKTTVLIDEDLLSGTWTQAELDRLKKRLTADCVLLHADPHFDLVADHPNLKHKSFGKATGTPKPQR